MKKEVQYYFSDERPNYGYCVRETLNGFSIMAYMLDCKMVTSLNKELAGRLDVCLPSDYRCQFASTERGKADMMLEKLAGINGWQKVLKHIPC